MAALDNVTLEAPSAAPLAPKAEPAAETNVPEAAELPPPIPQVQSGDVPAVLVPPITRDMLNDPRVSSLIELFPKFGELGIDTYETKDLSTVLYNPKKVTEQELKKAEEEGTLGNLATPLQALDERGVPQDPQAGIQAPLAGEPPPAPSSDPLDVARIRNLTGPQVSPVQPKPVTNTLSKRTF